MVEDLKRKKKKKFEKEMSRRIGEPSLTPYHELFEIAMERAGYEEGEEECHDTTLATLVDVPEEVCDLNPQKVKIS